MLLAFTLSTKIKYYLMAMFGLRDWGRKEMKRRREINSFVWFGIKMDWSEKRREGFIFLSLVWFV